MVLKYNCGWARNTYKYINHVTDMFVVESYLKMVGHIALINENYKAITRETPMHVIFINQICLFQSINSWNNVTLLIWLLAVCVRRVCVFYYSWISSCRFQVKMAQIWDSIMSNLFDRSHVLSKCAMHASIISDTSHRCLCTYWVLVNWWNSYRKRSKSTPRHHV